MTEDIALALDNLLDDLTSGVSSSVLLDELFRNLNIDDEVRFLHDFINDYGVNTDYLRKVDLDALEEHYKRHC